MKSYRRPVSGIWWTRNPFYRWYMLRELSSVLLVIYALTLLVGLVRLAQGVVPYEDWLESLSRPAAVAFHLFAFVVVLYHAWTWFKVMPKTLPRVPLSNGAIVVSGVAAALAASLLLFGAVYIGGLWSLL
jgi:fumarate reductase subunit C